MKKLLFVLTIVFFALCLFYSQVNAQPIPSHPCQGSNCWGKIQATRVGEHVYQEISYTLLLRSHLSETVEIEVNGLKFQSMNQQGFFSIEADKIDSAFFKILDVNGHLVYAAEWTSVLEKYETCVNFSSYDNTEHYFVITAGHQFNLDNRDYLILNQNFVTEYEQFPSIIREYVSGQIVRCDSLSKSLVNLDYRMDKEVLLPIVTK